MAQDIRSAISEAFDVSGNMVTLFVGVDATPFHIHEKLICGRSEFFKAALSKSWNQTQERKVPLPKDDPEIVQIYLRYLYSGKLFTRIEDDDLWVEGTDNHPEYIVLAELLVFGEKGD